jgi:predicted enzyme related to lactoylglutathione lyase
MNAVAVGADALRLVDVRALVSPRRRRGKLPFMEVIGLGWSGTRTERAGELARFYQEVLGLQLEEREPALWAFRLADGRKVEVFGPGCAGKDHMATGPVVGFAVADLPRAVEELRSAGIELLGEAGPTWQHFRGPDGNVYELMTESA